MLDPVDEWRAAVHRAGPAGDPRSACVEAGACAGEPRSHVRWQTLLHRAVVEPFLCGAQGDQYLTVRAGDGGSGIHARRSVVAAAQHACLFSPRALRSELSRLLLPAKKEIAAVTKQAERRPLSGPGGFSSAFREGPARG